MTCSVGFRAPAREELVREVLLRLADGLDDGPDDAGAAATATPGGDRYADPGQKAVTDPGRLPAGLLGFAQDGVRAALAEPGAVARALGEFLSEPKASVEFHPGAALEPGDGVVLATGSCMLYDAGFVFLNGEAWRASGADARDLRVLADLRVLNAAQVRRVSATLGRQLAQWVDCGWLMRVVPDGATG
jgi:50S ribosomal protein L16 3-hydroxylase